PGRPSVRRLPDPPSDAPPACGPHTERESDACSRRQGEMSLNEQVALITGASRGLGREVARLLARRGVRLILTARGAEALREAADALRPHTDVVALPGDIAIESHAERLVARGLRHFGRIDLLINNASSLGPTPMPRLEGDPGLRGRSGRYEHPDAPGRRTWDRSVPSAGARSRGGAAGPVGGGGDCACRAVRALLMDPPRRADGPAPSS